MEKLDLLDDSYWHGRISIETFLRANGVTVVEEDEPQIGTCLVEVAGTKIQGRFRVSLAWQRHQAIGLLEAMGVGLRDPGAG